MGLSAAHGAAATAITVKRTDSIKDGSLLSRKWRHLNTTESANAEKFILLILILCESNNYSNLCSFFCADN